MPRLPFVLALLGLIPFIWGAWTAHFGEGGWLGIARFSMPLYAAIILSFLGGAQWGMALAPGASRENLGARLVIAMIPSVAAWVIMTLPFTAPQNKYLILAGLLVLWAGIDHIHVRLGWAPDWYAMLRWPITVVAASCLVLGSLF